MDTLIIIIGGECINSTAITLIPLNEIVELFNFGIKKRVFVPFYDCSRLTPTSSDTSRSVLPKINRSIVLSCYEVSLGAGSLLLKFW